MILKSPKFDTVNDQKMTENSSREQNRTCHVTLIFQCSLACRVWMRFSLSFNLANAYAIGYSNSTVKQRFKGKHCLNVNRYFN